MGDMAISTSIGGTLPPLTSFRTDLFYLPPEFAGHSVDILIYDIGDVIPTGPGAFNHLSIWQPSVGCGAPTQFGSVPGSFTAYGLAGDYHDLQALRSAGTLGAYAVSTNFPLNYVNTLSPGGARLYNGKWLVLHLSIPTNYVSSPGCFWQLQYAFHHAIASDLFTYMVNSPVVPPHLL
jgi:hypothetical protein